jgi:hypothetical protein
MKSQVCSIVLLLIFVLGAISGSRDAFDSAEAAVQAEKEGLARKGMDIYLAYDRDGRVLKITIKSNQKDEDTRVALLMERQRVLSILEELMPEKQRGAKIGQHDGMSSRSGYGEVIVYENAQIDLSMVCRENACGVYYAEMRVKE